jgi:hypothetical protein
MSRVFFAAALLCVAACTPTLNWRETTLEPSGLHAMFPCKPDKVEHKVELAPGRPLVLHAVGCEAGGATFVVLQGDVGDMSGLADAITQWKKASLASMKSVGGTEQPWRPAGALGLQQSAMVRASGQSPNGKPLQVQAAYFARGTSMFQAAIYAREVNAEMSEPFFTGLRFE